jgi:hypothetical protein
MDDQFLPRSPSWISLLRFPSRRIQGKCVEVGFTPRCFLNEGRNQCSWMHRMALGCLSHKEARNDLFLERPLMLCIEIVTVEERELHDDLSAMMTNKPK